MNPATFKIGNPSDRLSLAYAVAKGYRITLTGDGDAEVVNPAGVAYHVRGWSCSCPDSLGRKGGSYAGRCSTSAGSSS